MRLALGARDLANNVIEVARRDTREKQSVSLEGIASFVSELLADIQNNMFHKAKTYRDAHITPVDTWDDFVNTLDEKGGFVFAHWDGTAETEAEIKEKTKATIRCIPIDGSGIETGTCVYSGKPSGQRVLFARAY